MIDWPTILLATVFAAVITAIGVVVTLLWTRRASKQRKLLLWTMSQSNVVSGPSQPLPGLDGIELRYRGSAIPAASVARITVWNDGTEAIPQSAITSENPLCVVLPEGATSLDVR